MYARTIGGEETTLGVSGVLWRDGLVLYDRATGSYWSQIDGSAIKGAHEGRSLTEIPSMVTSWGEWMRLYPETMVLSPPADTREGSRYAKYFDDAERMGIFGTTNPDPRLPGKSLVLGVRESGAAAAMLLSALEGGKLVQGSVGGTPIVAVGVAGEGALAFDRRIDGRVLDLRAREDGTLADEQTGSRWDRRTGVATEGPLSGRKLRAIEARRAYWFIWARFHPGTTLIGDALP